MNVLHISNGFADSQVHANLARELDALNMEQTIYCPVREQCFIGGNQFEGNNIKFIYSLCIKSWYKYVYYYKIWRLYQDMCSKVNLNTINYIHAHTLFSDGGLAYKAYKQYGIKYSVSIRNTDVNDYLRIMKHTYPYGRKILKNAENIFFISEGLKKTFVKTSFARSIIEDIKSKIVVQPNGIDDYWHQHISNELRHGHDILYVGDFTANKNVVRLGKAILDLKSLHGYEDVRLIIVGGEKKGIAWKSDGLTQNMIENNSQAIIAKGKIFEKDKLANVMHSCALFAMPSITETFGLVYLEALSQNLPVVYTKGQGIDGMFDETVGIGVDALSVDSIKNAIKMILDNPEKYGNKHVNFSLYHWKVIANNYYRYYKKALVDINH